MKFLSIISLLFFLIVVEVSGDAIELGSIDVYVFNLFTETADVRSLYIQYDLEDQVIFITTEDPSGRVTLRFSIEKQVFLESSLKKYLSWRELAIEKKVKLYAKPILEFKDRLFWYLNGSWYLGSCIISFRFMSESLEEHYFSVLTDKAVSTKNETISRIMHPWLLDKVAAESFLKVLSIEHILKKKAEYLKQKKIEEDFK